jgi:molybdopterin molybdotransferase
VTSWSEARATAAAWPPLRPVEVPVALAGGRELAAPLWSLVAVPPFDASAMDGYAVRGRGPWRVVDRVLAGSPPPAPLVDGEAVEVATGACLPPGAEGVVPYEQAVRDDTSLVAEPPRGRHVRLAGEECPRWTALLPAGTALGAAAVGLAAAVGHDALLVRAVPRVAAVVTGSELLEAGLPTGGAVRDAVGPLLGAAVPGYGGVLVAVRLVPDDAGALAAAVAAADADVVVTSGSTSVGHADLLPAVLAGLGAELLVHGVDVRPGHPQLLARLPDGRPLVGLPGNPLAALSALVTLVEPLLCALAGRRLPAPTPARLTAPLAREGATRLVPVRAQGGVAVATGHGGSAMLRGAAAATHFAVVPPGEGEATDVELLRLP